MSILRGITDHFSRKVDVKLKKQEIAAQKKQLLKHLQGDNEQLALKAIAEIRRNFWDIYQAALKELDSYNSHRERETFFSESIEIALTWSDLSDINLSGKILKGIDFHGIYFVLPKADFSYAELMNANFKNTNLYSANFTNSNLMNTCFTEANMIGADMTNANMQNSSLCSAYLYGAKLKNAYLERADLRDVRMIEADLENAALVSANLGHANLSNANLKKVNFDGAKFDRFTVLPDGSMYSSEEDLERFINPSHPNFWQPNSSVVWGTGEQEKKLSELEIVTKEPPLFMYLPDLNQDLILGNIPNREQREKILVRTVTDYFANKSIYEGTLQERIEYYARSQEYYFNEFENTLHHVLDTLDDETSDDHQPFSESIDQIFSMWQWQLHEFDQHIYLQAKRDMKRVVGSVILYGPQTIYAANNPFKIGETFGDIVRKYIIVLIARARILKFKEVKFISYALCEID